MVTGGTVTPGKKGDALEPEMMTGTGTLSLNEALTDTGAMKEAVTEPDAMTGKEAI